MEALDLSDGQRLARTLWGTHASGRAFDRKKSSYLTEEARTFIAGRSFCIIAGSDIHYELDGLIIPGEPGFIQTPDAETCLLSLHYSLSATCLVQKLFSSDGNNDPPRLALFFIDHSTRERLCVHGTILGLSCSEVVPSNVWAAERAIYIHLHVHQSFFHCAKYIKTRIPGLTSPVEVREMRAWSVQNLLSHPRVRLTEELCAFIAERTLCYLCTVDCYGQPAVNHRGGAPGFLVTLPPDYAHPGGQILLPDYSGNGAFEAIGNILEMGKATLIIPDYAAQLAICISGSTNVRGYFDLVPELARQCAGAERVIVLAVERIEIQTGDWSAALSIERARAETIEVLQDRTASCLVK